MENSYENPNKENPLASLIELLIEKNIITKTEFETKKESKKQNGN